MKYLFNIFFFLLVAAPIALGWPSSHPIRGAVDQDEDNTVTVNEVDLDVEGDFGRDLEGGNYDRQLGDDDDDEKDKGKGKGGDGKGKGKGGDGKGKGKGGDGKGKGKGKDRPLLFIHSQHSLVASQVF
jgi:hypothetical protein